MCCFKDEGVEDIFLQTFDLPRVGGKIRRAIALKFFDHYHRDYWGEFSSVEPSKNAASFADLFGGY